MSRRYLDHSSLQEDTPLQVRRLDENDLKDAEILSTQSTEGATLVLQRWLSVKSVISTASSNAIQQEEAAFNSDLQVFNLIGKGFCGEVYEKLGTNRVYKRELDLGNGKLWNDYIWHSTIYAAITSRNLDEEENAIGRSCMVRVPRVYGMITQRGHNWWNRNEKMFSKIAPRATTCLLETERIQPLPKIARQAIITLYCPQKYDKRQTLKDPANRNCLARVYLGVRRRIRSQADEFSLQNFEFDLQILDDIELEKEHLASEMARSLAIMHWKCRVSCKPVMVSFPFGMFALIRF